MRDGAITYDSKGGISAEVYGAAGRMPDEYRKVNRQDAKSAK